MYFQDEEKACLMTYKGHKNGVSPMIFIPAKETLEKESPTWESVSFEDLLITGSHDTTARSWCFKTGSCLQVKIILLIYNFYLAMYRYTNISAYKPSN